MGKKRRYREENKKIIIKSHNKTCARIVVWWMDVIEILQRSIWRKLKLLSMVFRLTVKTVHCLERVGDYRNMKKVIYSTEKKNYKKK